MRPSCEMQYEVLEVETDNVRIDETICIACSKEKLANESDRLTSLVGVNLY